MRIISPHFSFRHSFKNYIFPTFTKILRSMSTNMTTSESESITEGSTTIYVTNAKSTDVFYNPVQQFNRDMSIAVINQFVKDRENDEVFKGQLNSKCLLVSSNQPKYQLKFCKDFCSSLWIEVESERNEGTLFVFDSLKIIWFGTFFVWPLFRG